jgi:hypothetical protein
MSDITLIAKTALRESYTIKGCNWYTEYAIKSNLSQNEKEDIYNRFAMREIFGYLKPVVALRRRVDIINGETIPHEWDLMDVGKDAKDAAEKFGDGAFYSGIGLSPLHAEIVERSNRISELNKELSYLEDQTIQCKYERRSKLQREYEDKFNQELKDKKIYKKFLSGIAPADLLKEIRNRLQGEYQAAYNKIDSRIEEIKAELAELRQ